MVAFAYTAFDAAGKKTAGEIEAASRQDAIRQLNGRGLIPIEAQEKQTAGTSAGGAGSLWPRGRPKAADLTIFNRELGLLLTTGQTLSQGLATIRGDDAAPRIQALATRLGQAINGGTSFADALAAEGTLFPPIHIGMVKAAEMSGTLPAVLNRIADMRESEQRMRSKVVSALIYPVFLVATAVAAVLFLLGFVVPRFKSSLATQADALPASAALVFQASDILNAYGLWIGTALAALVALVVIAVQRPAAKAVWARLLLRLPVVGNLVRYAVTIRFCRTVSSLMSSGLNLSSTLALTRDVIGNEEARQLIDRLGMALRDGADFTEPLAKSPVFPPLVASLLRMGAESGAVADVAARLATMYETKLDVGLQRLMSVLEPVIILAVGAFVAFIVLSIMSAILGVYDLSGV